MARLSEQYKEVARGVSESFFPTLKLKEGGIEGEGYLSLRSTSEKMLKLKDNGSCSEFKEIVEEKKETAYVATFNNNTVKNILAVTLEGGIDLPYAEILKVKVGKNDPDKNIVQAIPVFELAMAFNANNSLNKGYMDANSVIKTFKAKLVELGNIYRFRQSNSITPIMIFLNTEKGLEYIGVFFYQLGISTKIDMQKKKVSTLFSLTEGVSYNLGFTTYRYDTIVDGATMKVSVCNAKLNPLGNISSYKIYDSGEDITLAIQEVWDEEIDGYRAWAERRVNSFLGYFSDIANNNIDRLLKRNEELLGLEAGSLSVNSGMVLENKANVLEIASKKSVDDVPFSIDDND